MIRKSIKQAMVARGWATKTGKPNIRILAKETGIRYETLTTFLSGRTGINIVYLEKIFKLLDLEVKHKENQSTVESDMKDVILWLGDIMCNANDGGRAWRSVRATNGAVDWFDKMQSAYVELKSKIEQ